MTTSTSTGGSSSARSRPIRSCARSSASADFPSTLRIRVHEYEPVAVADRARRASAIAVASDGTLLPRIAKATLPTVGRAGAAAERTASRARACGRSWRAGGGAARCSARSSSAPTSAKQRDPGRDARRPDARIRHRRPARGQVGRRHARARGADRPAGAATIDVRLPERPAASGFARRGPLRQTLNSESERRRGSTRGSRACDPAAARSRAADCTDAGNSPIVPNSRSYGTGLKPQAALEGLRLERPTPRGP